MSFLIIWMVVLLLAQFAINFIWELVLPGNIVLAQMLSSISIAFLFALIYTPDKRHFYKEPNFYRVFLTFSCIFLLFDLLFLLF